VKVEGIVFSLIGAFLAVTAVVYWFWSKDPTGTTALAISFGLGGLIGGYLLVTARRIDPRPSDLPDAEVADGAGEVGHFSPGSYFPFFISAAAATILLGLEFGIWLAILGVIVLLISVTGLLFENLIDHHQGETAVELYGPEGNR
jgi:hypothetical protein